jgi:hypothetical protein
VLKYGSELPSKGARGKKNIYNNNIKEEFKEPG